MLFALLFIIVTLTKYFFFCAKDFSLPLVIYHLFFKMHRIPIPFFSFQAEKQNNKAIRKLLIQQNRIKRQIRLCRESGDSGVSVDDYSPVTSPSRPWSPSTDFSILTVYSSDSSSDRLDRLKIAVQKIEEKLAKERMQNGRPKALEEMTHEQVIQENASLQNALTQYEIVLNHETTDDEKSVLKELLARY